MAFRPLDDRILVKRIEETEPKHGALVVPETAKEKPLQGKVLSVGPGKRDKEGERRALVFP